MNKKFMPMISIVLVLIASYLIVQCSRSNKKFNKVENNAYSRLISQLKNENVISTPFKDLLKNFAFFEENLYRRLVNLHQLSTSKERVWAATTSHSILGYDENKCPQQMEVFWNNNRISMLDEADENSVKWKWIKTNKDVEITNDENYNRGFKCLILDENDSFSFETILPGAPIEIEILARRNWHPIDIEVYLNDNFIEKKEVKRTQEVFRILKKTTAGTYKITLKPSISKKVRKKNMPTPPRLLIYKIKINTQNDIILFFVPSKKQAEFLKSSIKTHYFSSQDKSGKENKYQDLHRMKYDFTLDKFDQKENPENIKKKIVLENLSLDVLMAPPKSEFEFKMNVLPKSYLEFGIGIFSYKEIDQNHSAKFKIFIEENKTKKLIYEHNFQLKPGRQRNQLIIKKIDLAPFGEKNIKLTFLTEKSENSFSDNNVLSFWSNPMIYQSLPEKLKIILVSLDTLRADRLGCYGYQRPTSPNIDELAKDSVLFENVYAQSPWTLPSHISMLFSLNSASHQVYYNNQKIDNTLPSLSSILQNKGFITYAFTGGGYVSSMYGFSKGFDWYDEPIGGRYAPLASDESEKLFDYTSDWLKKNKDKQFFLFLHTFQTHGPYSCPAPWNEIFLDENAKWKKINLRYYLDHKEDSHQFTQEEIQNISGLYDGEIRYTDETFINPLISLLKELEIYENTLLVITSDHGEEFYDHQGWLHGRTVYDELIRVPLIIKLPNSEFKGKRIKTKCRLIDIMPTLLEAASIKYKKYKLEGKSLMPLITEKEREDRIFFSDLAYKNVPLPCPALVATNRDNFKLILEKSAKGIKGMELYDLLKDPEETTDIFPDKIKLGEKLAKIIDDYYRIKQKIHRKKEEVHLDEKLKEKLRALGYLR